MAYRSAIAGLQWRRALRPAPGNRRALADSTLAAYNGLASGPTSAGNRLAGRSPTIGDALRIQKIFYHYTFILKINIIDLLIHCISRTHNKITTNQKKKNHIL